MGGKAVFRARPDQSVDVVAPLKKKGNQDAP
jgi:hypothetical protein